MAAGLGGFGATPTERKHVNDRIVTTKLCDVVINNNIVLLKYCTETVWAVIFI